MNSASTTPRLGIVISMFPELHETFILRELIALQRHGVDFEIFSLQHPRDPITIDEAITLSNDKTHYSKLFSWAVLSTFSLIFMRHPLRCLKAVAKLIWWGRDRPLEVLKNLAILPLSLYFGEKGRSAGITHWHGHWANIPTTTCWYLSQVHQCSWSAAIHGEDIFTANRFLAKKLDDATFAVVCSGYFCNHLQHNIGLERPSSVHLNYHGLDPRVTERAPHQRISTTENGAPMRLLSIGRLVATKGHDIVIDACAKLMDAGIAFNLQIVGSGPIEAELKQQIANLNLQDHVELTGGMAFSDVLQTLEQANVFCLAPRMIPGQPPDGIPNVIAEAMALRVPVVTTSVSAIPELVEDGVSGLLVPCDDASAFAAAVQRLAEQPQLAQQLSDNAAEKVGHRFDQNRNINELLELFRQYVPGRAVR